MELPIYTYRRNQCFATCLAMVLSVFMLACGGSSDKEVISTDYSQLKIAPIKNEPLKSMNSGDFGHYLKNGIRLRLNNSGSVEALATPADSGAPQSRFSTTNVHEIGVDEDDRLKFDGEHIFLMEDYYFPYTNNGQSQSIRILETDPLNAQATEVSVISNQSDNLPFSGLYLHQLAEKKSLVSLSASHFFAWDAMLVDADWVWSSGKTAVNLYDVSDPANPQLDWQIEIEGNLEGSRKIGNKLYLITHYIPNIPELDFSAQSEQEKIANEKRILDTPISDLLPHYQVNDGGVRSLVSAQDCLVAGEVDPNEGYADIITVTSIDIDSRTIESSTCLNANVHGIYSSTESLYIGASGQVSWAGFSEGTAIHKFSLAAGSVAYRGSGYVSGYLGWSDPAFRMSEYQGDLRIVTTNFTFNGPAHELNVFRESDNNQLERISTLPNENETAPIGKPGEDIFAVRFVDEKAYIITFRQIDPLYEIDLSDPAAPHITSELEMPGFARYLHPLSDGWLLGVGQAVENNRTGGIKVELYDLRNPGAPLVKDTVILGGAGSWSEALSDLKSMSFLAINSDSRQLSLPVNRYDDVSPQTSYLWQDSGLHLFEISGFDSAELSLNYQGAIITESNQGAQNYPTHWGNGRSTLLLDAIYYFQGNQLWSVRQGELSNVYGPH